MKGKSAKQKKAQNQFKTKIKKAKKIFNKENISWKSAVKRAFK